MLSQSPEPTNGSRKTKPRLDAPELELTAMLHEYCDLRRRSFSQTESRTKFQWKRHYPSLMLAGASRRGMAGSQENQTDVVAEWLLTMFDAGAEIHAIQQMSALSDRQIKRRLKRVNLKRALSKSPS